MVGAVFKALAMLHLPSENPIPLDLGNLDNAQIIERLRDVYGDFFAGRLVNDAVWARGVLVES
jgi:transcription initiation factor TFIID subunit 6